MHAIDGSLERFGLDFLDVVYCHRADPETPIEETVEAMSDIIESGRAHYWGTSEWSADEIRAAWDVADRRNLRKPITEQPQYNLFERQKVEADYLPVYDTFGLGTTIWSPLYSGLLTGKYNDGIPQDSRMNLAGYEWLRERLGTELGKSQLVKVKALAGLAEKAGLTVTNLALLWCLSNPRVSTVILGASRASQLADNLSALEQKAKLTPEVMAEIETIMANKPAGPQRF